MSFEYEVLPEIQDVVYKPIVFTLSPIQVARFEAWKAGFAYSGSCCGGGFTFSFTPTSVGTIVGVVHGKTGTELDLTEDM
jgi:hypothetical protein